MLQREHSDFQWYRERAASLSSQAIVEYGAAAQIMSGSNVASTQPPVPGKSFADAAAQPPTTNGHTNKGKPVRVAKPKEDGSVGYDIVEQERKEQEYVLRNRMNGKSQAQHKGKEDGDGVYDNNVVYENIPNGEGSFLTTVKPSTDFEASLLHSELTKPRSRSRGPDPKPMMTAPEPELKSGRQPGKGWDQSAIRWAPLNVPLKRRFQTMAVLWHTISIALFLSMFFFACAFPPAWLLLTPYLIYSFVLYDDPNNGTLSRRSEFLKRLKIWSAFGEYFPAQLHKTQDLEPYRKYIFGYHPHGIISHGAFAAFATEALGFSVLFPGITNTLLTLETNFRVPFYRDYALAMGLASVSRESITNILSKGGRNGRGMGRAVTIVIGGARESLEAKPHQMKLILNERKGFIKQAIRAGADLVPVIGFGENDLYDQVDSDSHPLIRKAQLLVKKLLGFTLPLFHARGIFNYDSGLMPYRRALNIVVGKPIEVTQQGGVGEGDDGHIDVAYIEELHEQYVAEVKRLWETHKDKFAPDREMELEIE